MLGKIAPLGVVAAQQVADYNIGRARLVEAGDDVRSDESGPTGDQKHSTPRQRLDFAATFAPVGGRAQSYAVWAPQNAGNRVKIATGHAAGAQGNALLCPPRHWGATGTSGAEAMSHEVNQAAAPVVIIPFVWIGDFVRCHSVVRLLRAQNPDRAVDIVSSTLCAPLADYMPGIRRTIVADLPRRRLGVAQQRQLAGRLREAEYGQALVMSRKWKAAIAPWLAGIPV